MKKIIVVLMAVCMLLALVSCTSGSEAPEGMKDVAREKDPFNFYVPQNWMSYSGDVVGAYEPSDKSNITIMPYGGYEGSSESYWNDFETRCKKEFEEFEASEPETKIVAKTNAIKYEYKMKVDGTKYQCRQYLLAYGNIVYVITYTSTEENFNEHTDKIDKIISEFKFK